MPISRVKVNALVDDDGSNTVGTLYQKQNVVDIYNDIDALVAPAEVWTPFTPAMSAQGGGTVTLGSGSFNCAYMRGLGVAHFSIGLEGLTLAGVVARISLQLPFTPTRAIWINSTWHNGASYFGDLLCEIHPFNSGRVDLYRYPNVGTTAFPPGTFIWRALFPMSMT